MSTSSSPVRTKNKKEYVAQKLSPTVRFPPLFEDVTDAAPHIETVYDFSRNSHVRNASIITAHRLVCE